MRRSRIQSELKQRKPFRSRGQEATVALLRTASVVSRTLSRVLEPWKLSLAQYNALRIIRGTPRTIGYSTRHAGHSRNPSRTSGEPSLASIA